jgi:hypothetical protein
MSNISAARMILETLPLSLHFHQQKQTVAISARGAKYISNAFFDVTP